MEPIDEQNSSKLWRSIVLVTSLLIILAIIYFITSVIVINPLTGLWYCEEQRYTLTVKKDGTAELEREFEDEYLRIGFRYDLDKSNRIVTFKIDENAYAQAVKDSKTEMKAGELKDKVDVFFTAYEYSLDKGELTLTEREYAEQYIFTRVEK